MSYVHAAAIMLFVIPTLDWLIFQIKHAPKRSTFPEWIWLAGWVVGIAELGWWL